MKDLETKVEIARELTDLLNILDVLEGNNLINIEMSVTRHDNKDKYSFDIEDPVLFNMIKEYVQTKARKLDANFKLTSF